MLNAISCDSYISVIAVNLISIQARSLCVDHRFSFGSALKLFWFEHLTIYTDRTLFFQNLRRLEIQYSDIVIRLQI